jgi:hypothetical protein
MNPDKLIFFFFRPGPVSQAVNIETSPLLPTARFTFERSLYARSQATHCV